MSRRQSPRTHRLGSHYGRVDPRALVAMPADVLALPPMAQVHELHERALYGSRGLELSEGYTDLAPWEREAYVTARYALATLVTASLDEETLGRLEGTLQCQSCLTLALVERTRRTATTLPLALSDAAHDR